MSKIVVIEHLTRDGAYQGPGRPDEDRVIILTYQPVSEP